MNTTGYYGKLPQRGDFVSGKIPTTFKNTWDDWAQQLVIANNELQQQGSAQPWFHLPVYRFYLSSMIAGDNAWVGVMLPSADSVGRLFPFCLARDIDPAISAAEAMASHQAFYETLESLIQQLYSNELSFANLNDTLTQLDAETAVTAAADTATIARQSSEPALSIRITTPADTGDPRFWQSATSAVLSLTCAGHSFWTTSALSNSSCETLICEGLPSANCCKSLFHGNFDALHWTQFNQSNLPAERRDANHFTNDDTPPPADPIPVDMGGDTKPIHKIAGNQPPREADFLELDDSEQPDAPWE